MVSFARIISLCVCFLLVACGPAPAPLPTAPLRTALSGEVRVYRTPTPTQVEAFSVTFTPPPLAPSPTPTPFVHVIVKSETLGGIAFRYGVPLDQILAANPGINPLLLSVGQKVVIPLEGLNVPVQPAGLALPELTVPPPQCFAQTTGDAWCLTQVQNDQLEAFESVSLRFILTDLQGAVITESVAATPLNLLPGAGALPVIIHFPSQRLSWQEMRLDAELVAVLPVASLDERYTALVLDGLKLEPNASALTGKASGLVGLSGPARRVWVLGVAYDTAGYPVGVRRVELTDPCLDGIQSCPLLPFEMFVYSVGPEIAGLSVLAEAWR